MGISTIQAGGIFVSPKQWGETSVCVFPFATLISKVEKGMKQKLLQWAAKNKFIFRSLFIVYRLRSLLYSALFLVCRIFPIEENKIVCCNLSGRGCGDNPRYILEEINRQGLDYQMYWLLNEAPEMPLPEGVRWVPNTTFSSAYHLSTAKIWIDTHNKK